MNPTTSPQKITQVEEEVLDDELVVYRPEEEKVYNLNGTGAFIWSLCDGNHTLKEIVSEIHEATEEVPKDQIASDVQEFVETMLDNGLLQSDGLE